MKSRKIVLIISSIMILSLVLSGCSKEKSIVIDTEVQNNENKAIEFKEETIYPGIGENEQFIPKYFNGDKVYGVVGRIGAKPENEQYPISGFYKENFYTLEKDGVLKETDSKPIVYNSGIAENEGISYEDTIMGEYDENSELYYFNYKNYEKKKIGISSSNLNITMDMGSIQPQIIEGQSEYGYTMVSKKESENVEFTKKLLIFGINNGEKYTIIGADESSIADIVYSEIDGKFYAINSMGKVYSVELKNSEARFVEEGNIDIEWLNELNKKGDTVDSNGNILFSAGLNQWDITVNENGEILILNRRDYGKVLTTIYNPKTKKTTIINKEESEEIRVLKYFTKGNKVILGKMDEEVYLGEIKEDYIKIITKIDIAKDEGEYSSFDDAIISEDGKKLLIQNMIFKSEEENLRTDVRYGYKIFTF